MPVMTCTGTWQVTECMHCNQLFAVQSDDTWAAYALYKEHLKTSPFCQKASDDAGDRLFGRTKTKHDKDNIAILSENKTVSN